MAISRIQEGVGRTVNKSVTTPIPLRPPQRGNWIVLVETKPNVEIFPPSGFTKVTDQISWKWADGTEDLNELVRGRLYVAEIGGIPK